MDWREKDIATWFELRRQLNLSGLSRREAARLGLLASSGMMVGLGGSPARAQLALPAWPPSPPLTPFLEPMPIPESLEHVDLDPPPTASEHQFYSRFPAQKTYQVRLKEASHRWHPDLPSDKIWGYDGYYPGPNLDLRYGEPVVLRIRNGLPGLDQRAPGGFGLPSATTHLHNFHTASESDGGPWGWTDPGGYKDHHYTMARAGFTVPGLIPAEFRAGADGRVGTAGEGGDVRESLTSLFLHDHRPEYTAANVYKGMMAGCRVFDQQDSGSEESGWQLPSGPHDVPLVLADKRFDSNGELFFDPFFTEGFLGDHYTVNGAVQPYLEVKKRKYRFRVYNPGPSRTYRLVLRHGNSNRPMVQITEGGNFLEQPATITSFDIWVAERFDLIIDFSGYKTDDRLYLVNRARMLPDGRGVDNFDLNIGDPANRVLEFRVTDDAVDPSRIPSYFRPLPPLTTADVVRTRTWVLGRKNGMWTINDRLWDPEIDHRLQNVGRLNQVRRNTSEIWRIQAGSGGWDHPMHIHFEEGQLLKTNGRTPARRFRTDVYRLGRNGFDSIEILLQFRDFPEPGFTPAPRRAAGEYVMHCHNTVHEDHAMMTTFNIVP
jgi:FtsP/CotA-like multicopper oxidase with cupredoxin domain